jgi:Fe-S-cluster containining protein
MMKNPMVAKINLALYGRPVELNLLLPAERVKPTRMLPVLQNITNKFMDAAVEAFVGKDHEISCRAGCGACCRQPVPLAKFETYYLAELVERLPEPRRTQIKQRFDAACEHLEKIDWFGRLEKALDRPDDKNELKKLALEYFSQGIACPFLEAESCSIHPDRPLSCREYLVTSPPENCQSPTPETIDEIELKFKISEVVRRLWKTADAADNRFVTMIYALEWAKKNPDEFDEKTGEQWLKEFFNHLSTGEKPAK